jgi:tetratricopeptide (TPR) repeat protein
MKGLSIRQPYAWAVCTGAKTTENRPKPVSYRGLVLIHASNNPSNMKEFLAATTGKFKREEFAFQAIIGAAELFEVSELNESLENDPTAFGPYCWRLRNPHLFRTPIPCKGQVGLFNVSGSEEEKAAEQLSLPSVAVAHERLASYKVATECEQPEVVRAGSYLQLENCEDAIRTASLAIKRDSATVDPWVCRSIARWWSGDYEECSRDSTQAIVLDPKDVRAYYYRHLSYLMLDREDDAENDYAVAEKLDPAYVKEQDAILESLSDRVSDESDEAE